LDAIKFLLSSGDANDAARALAIGVVLLGWMWWRIAKDFRAWLKER